MPLYIDYPDRYARCSACDGTGTVSCISCKGTGYRYERRLGRDYLGNPTSEEEQRNCTVCGGRGRSACSRCDGYGNQSRASSAMVSGTTKWKPSSHSPDISHQVNPGRQLRLLKSTSAATPKSTEERLREANASKRDSVKCLKESIDYRAHKTWQTIYDLSLEELSNYTDLPKVPAFLITLKHVKSLVERMNPYLLDDDRDWKLRQLLWQIHFVILSFEIVLNRKRLEDLL
jgi:hypothetical protein